MAEQYVVDASVLCQLFITQEHTPQTERFFADVPTLYEVFVPEMCLVECTNVFWKHTCFHGLPAVEATQLAHDLVALPLQIVPSRTLLTEALTIGVQNRLPVYDSLYIALAQDLSKPLISDDKRQCKVAVELGLEVVAINRFFASVDG